MKYFINHCEYTKEALLETCHEKSLSSVSWERDLYSFIIQWFDDNDYVIGYSSGTTGSPKKMKLLKDRMRISAQRTVEHLKLKSSDTALLSLSANYIAGKMMIVRALEYGFDLITIEPSMKALLLLNERIDFAALVPYQVSELMEKRKTTFKNIKTLIIGGASVSNQLLEELNNISTVCYSTYGMTETLSHIALKRLNGDNPDKFYKAMKGVSISQDDRSCLQVVAYGNEVLTTNDIVKIYSKSSFEWLGRYDNIINSGGLKFIPEQIESKIKHLLSSRYIISSVKDEKLGNRIILIIESKPSPIEQLHVQLENVLAKYEMPKEISFVDKFMETSSGKIIRI